MTGLHAASATPGGAKQRPISLMREVPDQPDIREMIAALNAYLLSVYRAEECHHLTVEELMRPDVSFRVARDGGTALAIGALRRLGPADGEVKRMWTAPAARGRGLGRLILRDIEAEARRTGLERLLLETGAKLTAAVALYRSEGFVERGPFHDYAENGASLFLEKRLAS